MCRWLSNGEIRYVSQSILGRRRLLGPILRSRCPAAPVRTFDSSAVGRGPPPRPIGSAASRDTDAVCFSDTFTEASSASRIIRMRPVSTATAVSAGRAATWKRVPSTSISATGVRITIGQSAGCGRTSALKAPAAARNACQSDREPSIPNRRSMSGRTHHRAAIGRTGRTFQAECATPQCITRLQPVPLPVFGRP